MEKPKIVFFGTPEFAVCSLKRILDDGYEVAAVVTMPDKESGRGRKISQSDVKKFAVENGLRVLQPEKLKSPEFIEELRKINADLFIVIAFRMLPEVVWSMPRLGTFNLHGSLLPKYRGAAPINRAIMNGEKETGVTTFFLKHEIDTGDMIQQRKIEILDEDNAGTIHDKLMELGAEMVSQTISAITDGTLETFPQPEGEFIPAPKIFKEDCRIDWAQDSVYIHNLVRGLSPYPAAFSTLVLENGREMDVKIFRTALCHRNSDSQPGQIIVENRRMFVKTADAMLEVLEIQPSGKRPMEVHDFLLGYKPESFK